MFEKTVASVVCNRLFCMTGSRDRGSNQMPEIKRHVKNTKVAKFKAAGIEE